MSQLSGTTVEVERTKCKIDLAHALKLCQLSGTTVEVERTKCKIDLTQALKLCQLSGTTVELEGTKFRKNLAQGPQAVSNVRYHCEGGEDQRQADLHAWTL
jgi:hypothetical protein